MGIVIDILSWVFIAAGAFFVIVGGVGLLRLPDFYTRVHAAGMTDTMGSWLILLGLMLQAGWSLVTVKLALVLIFLVMTCPLSSHALTKAAYFRGLKPLLGPRSEWSEEE